MNLFNIKNMLKTLKALNLKVATGYLEYYWVVS